MLVSGVLGIILTIVSYAGGDLTLLYEKQPANVVLANPNYRTPEAGLRFYANANSSGGPAKGPARFIIDKADEQSVGLAVPSMAGSRPVDGPFLNGRIPANQNSVTVEVQLIKLINDGGILADGESCDVFRGACDPVCYINVDFDRPNEAYPGGAVRFVQIANVDNYNSPALDVVFPGHACAATYKEANVRVYCEDIDPTADADLINKWSCPIKQTPAASKGFSQWSSPAECHPVHQAGKIRLTYKYKVYYGSDQQCNHIQPAATASGSRRNSGRNGAGAQVLTTVVDPKSQPPNGANSVGGQRSNGSSLRAVIDPVTARTTMASSYNGAVTETPIGRRIFTAKRLTAVVQPQQY